MSGECESCGEHALECGCQLKELTKMRIMDKEEFDKMDAQGRLEKEIQSIRLQIAELEERLEIYMFVSRDSKTFEKLWKILKQRI